MLSRLVNFREEREGGFTLVELLVVIIIIGILAAIAIPVFLNQRQRANDAAVQAAVKSYVNAAESWLVANPNATEFVASGLPADRRVLLEAEGARKSDGVMISVVGNTPNGPIGYRICGYHTNGKTYRSSAAGENYSYQSAGAGIGGQFTLGTNPCPGAG